jgi:hypothetical protein
MKEKVFGFSITIKPDIKTIYPSIINDYKDLTKQLLNNYSERVMGVYELLGSNNLRLLKRALDILDYIIEDVNKYLDTINNIEIRNKVTEALLTFILGCYYTIKKNNMNIDNEFLEIETAEISGIRWGFPGKKQNYRDIVISKFKHYDIYIHIRSLARYIVDGNLDNQELIQDLTIINEICNSLVNESKINEDVADQLTYYYSMEESEFQLKLDKLFSNITGGYYNIGSYPKLIGLVNLLYQYNLIDKTKEEIIELIENGINNSDLSGVNVLIRKDIRTDENDNNEMGWLLEKASFKSYYCLSKDDTDKLEKLLSESSKGNNESIRELIEYFLPNHKSIFSIINIESLIRFLKVGKNENLVEFIYFINEKYNRGSTTFQYINEIEYIEKIIGRIGEIDLDGRVKRKNVDDLVALLKEIILKLKESKKINKV